MQIYCVSKNTGPTWSGPDPVHMVYLGTSIKEAEEAVGTFTQYQKEKDRWPVNYLDIYTALPRGMEFEMIQYFMADGWWYSIVMFTLEENNG